MTTQTIKFSVQGEVSQEIEIIDKNYTINDVIDGLNNGTLVTTTWYEKCVEQEIETLDGEKIVAKILSQKIDGEYMEYDVG